MKIIVAGGTGFIGRTLVRRFLEQGHAVVVLTRNPSKADLRHENLTMELWDGKTLGSWRVHCEGSDAIVNVTGELIAGKRWTRQQKEIILNSRVDATRALVGAIGASLKRPSLLINCSGVGYYGSVPSGDVPESFPNGDDFLASVCRVWEDSALQAATRETRVVTPRFGVVLGEGGGALKRMVLPFRLYAGGYLGTGEQWFPWIHIEDLIRGLMFIVDHKAIHGPVNFTAPEAVTMKTFCTTMGNVLRSPSWTAVPSFILRLALGEMAEMLLTGQRAVPRVLLNSGFVFQYPALSDALASIYKK